MKTSGNTVLITGGGTGIGLALARALVERNNQVVVCGRRRDRLRAAERLVPGLAVRVCDVSNPRSRLALVRWVVARFRSLNILVNNAGIQRPIDFRRGPRDLAQVDLELVVNVGAPVHLAGLLIPHLKRRKQAAIVNISSGLGFTPLAAVPVYCATKAALHSLSLSMRHQLRDTSIQVFEIIPPVVATELSGWRRRPTDRGPAMSAEEAATGILDALERDEHEVALGMAANLHRQREALFGMIND
jgi:uncharacterized oxidoreductase